MQGASDTTNTEATAMNRRAKQVQGKQVIQATVKHVMDKQYNATADIRSKTRSHRSATELTAITSRYNITSCN